MHKTCFTNVYFMPLHVSSNIFSSSGQKLYYTASGIITLKQMSGLKLIK